MAINKTSLAQGGVQPTNERVERVRHLLRRYPELSEEESMEIWQFLRKGALLDQHALSLDEELAPQVQRFRKDHSDLDKIGTAQIATLAIVLLVFVLLVALLWDAGAGR